MATAFLLRNINKKIYGFNRFFNKTINEANKTFSTGIDVSFKDRQNNVSSSTDLRYNYREFLPDPKSTWRNSVREQLERSDMIKRRMHVDVPDFFVGSILAVTTSDVHSAGKVNRFVGICIHREGCGLRANFILRNVIDHQGIEVLYDIYDPTIRKIEILKLERRLDDKLFYLRDALPEYSTFDVNMEPELLPEDAPVPINPIKVKLKPRPWLERWQRQNLKGVADLEYDDCRAQPWEKYDLMKQYKATIPEEEQRTIFTEVYSELHHLEVARKKMKRKRAFTTPKKTA